MTPLLVLPIVVPLGAAVVSLVAWRAPAVQRVVSLAGAAGLLACGLSLVAATSGGDILVTQLGAWPAPFGITLVADLFSALMVAVGGLMGLAAVVYSFATIDRDREAFGYHALLQALLAGVSGAFLTGDIFNLFVWFEVLLMASFVLLALGGGRDQVEGTVKYLLLNLMASVLFLIGVGILYGLTGTLNMADLSRVLERTGPSGALTTVAMMFLVAYGIKAAVFPLFFWLPASYHTPPVAVSAVFAGLLTKVGVYALIRVFTLLFVHDTGVTHSIILVVAGLTMVTGVLGALAQQDFRRVLSFHIVSQIGYMIMGLGLFTPLALAGSVFYVIHHIIVKTNLFLISGIVLRLHGTLELKRLGGVYRTRPLLGVLFLVPALSLAGLPPLSGFFGKLVLLQASLEVGAYFIAAVAVGVSLFTLMSMMKLWNEAFWKDPPDDAEAAAAIHATRPGRLGLVLPVAALAALTVGIGLGAQPFFTLSQRAADQLMAREPYIRAVLGAAPGGAVLAGPPESEASAPTAGGR
jgi:multicomponent Na+:H+ antiporter subunit D